MKKIFIPVLLCLLVAGCKNAATNETATASKAAYAYTIDKPDNWEIGSSQNTAVALASLKAIEDNKIDECLGYFADSVVWKFDNMNSKISKDSLKSILLGFRNQINSISIKMGDFVSNISKDKKDEWVTMWYDQTVTDKTGMSVTKALINDVKLEKGKIVEIDEATRLLPPNK